MVRSSKPIDPPSSCCDFVHAWAKVRTSTSRSTHQGNGEAKRAGHELVGRWDGPTGPWIGFLPTVPRAGFWLKATTTISTRSPLPLAAIGGAPVVESDEGTVFGRGSVLAWETTTTLVSLRSSESAIEQVGSRRGRMPATS